MIAPITQKQRRVLDYFLQYHEIHGVYPTFKIAWETLSSHPSVVHVHVKNLKKKWFLLNDTNIWLPSEIQSVHLLGSIACWEPIAVFEDVTEFVDVPESNLKWGGNFYALRARGQSMINAWIRSWDVLLIRQQSDVMDGEIGVVIVWDDEYNEKATLKRVYHSPNALILHPANDDFPTQVIKNGDIRWKLISVIRNY